MKRRIITYLVLIIVYLILAIPFKGLTIIPGFSDIRPVTLLGPIYALFFGVPGCSIFALMNLVMDAFSGGLMWSSIAGLIANFIGPFLILLYWTKYSKTTLHLKKPGNILHFSLTLIIVAVIQAAIITPCVALLYPDVDWKLFFASVVFNTAVFPILFSTPLILLMRGKLGFKQIGYVDPAVK
ncbi:MAG: hypothetical protein IKR78_05785 [Dehalococcoidales bacterium]|nr:hypothetical protein [Dehalococcoidales bacterium]